MMDAKVTRRGFLQVLGGVTAGVGSMRLMGARAASSSGFDWKRFSGTSLHFMISDEPWTQQVQKKLPEFESLTGIKVNWEVFDEDSFRAKLPLALRTSPESVDGFLTLPSWDAAAFSKAGWYEPLDKYTHSGLTSPDYALSDFFPNIRRITTVKGELIGIPLWPEVQLLYYNTTVLSHERVPKTLDEFLSTAESLTNRSKGFAGYVTRGKGRQAVYTFAPFLFAFGGRWQDENGRPELNSGAAVKAFAFYGSILRKAGPANIAGLPMESAEAVFAEGHAAMYTDADDWTADMENPAKSRLVGKVGYATLPRGPAGVRSSLISWGLAICSKSPKKDAAWYLIQFLTNRRMTEFAAQAKLPVPRQSVWNSEAYQAGQPKGWLDSIRAEIPTAVPNGANPSVIPVPEVRDAIGKGIVAVLQGGDPTKAANEAQKDVLQVLGMK